MIFVFTSNLGFKKARPGPPPAGTSFRPGPFLLIFSIHPTSVHRFLTKYVPLEVVEISILIVSSVQSFSNYTF